MSVVDRRHDAAVRVLNELRDMPVPVDITVVDPAHLDEEASVPGVLRAAPLENRELLAYGFTNVFTTDRVAWQAVNAAETATGDGRP